MYSARRSSPLLLPFLPASGEPARGTEQTRQGLGLVPRGHIWDTFHQALCTESTFQGWKANTTHRQARCGVGLMATWEAERCLRSQEMCTRATGSLVRTLGDQALPSRAGWGRPALGHRRPGKSLRPALPRHWR